MSDYSSEDIVKYSISGDGARVKEAIHGVLADKVMKHLEAKKADIPVKLIQAPGKNYYQLLRKKLHWGGTAENNS